MSASKIEIPRSELDKVRRTLREYAAVSRKTETQIVNQKSADWARFAAEETKKASSAAIQKELGRTVFGIGFNKKGRQVITKAKSSDVMENSLASRIVNATRKRQGLKMLWGKPLKAAAVKLIRARVRSIAFLSSGWQDSWGSLKKQAKGIVGFVALRNRGKKAVGTATVARESVRPMATITNGAADNPQAGKFVQEGLLRGLPRVIADMHQYIDRKMKEAAKKVR